MTRYSEAQKPRSKDELRRVALEEARRKGLSAPRRMSALAAVAIEAGTTRYEIPTPNLDPFGLKLLGGRLLPGNAGRAAALYMYESASGERFTIYCRRDQTPQSGLRYRASGPFGSVFWIEDEVAFVVSGPADRARLRKVAEAVYEQIETRQQTSSLLRMLSDNPNWNGIAPWADALITGLVVGSGTKPVHDVIQRFQNTATGPQTPL